MTETARVISELENVTNELKVRVASRILQVVVFATPVGNPELWDRPESAPPGYVGGTARANWQVAIDRPIAGTVDTPDPGGGGTVQAGQGTARSANVGQAVWLVNNLPYIGRLNDGHSTQAPAGFIEAGIQAAISRERST